MKLKNKLSMKVEIAKPAIFFAFWIAFLGLVPGVMAQDTVETDPGMITPESAFYGLEVAFENVGMNIGLLEPTNIAYERASEMDIAQESNNTEGLDRASGSFNQAMERVQNREQQTEREQENLEKAEKVLERVKENAPNEAQTGLQNAIDQVSQQKQRGITA